jgi:indole-3-glycerol phosphate synthase
MEAPGFGVIAEVKRQSPSAGLIRPAYAGDAFDPAVIAREYAISGAAAISCLTEERFFGGRLAYLSIIRESVSQPILRKDFIVSSYQVLQARAAGADAVLLMAELAGQALALGLDVLVEAHDDTNVPLAWEVVKACGERALLGINNRDLTTMQVDLGHTARMVHRFGLDAHRVVAESGVREPADLAALASVGVRKVLVGEHLMRQASPGDALARLLRVHS